MLNTTQNNITTTPPRGISPSPTLNTGGLNGCNTGVNFTNIFNLGGGAGLQGNNNFMQMIMLLLQQMMANTNTGGQGGGVIPGTTTPGTTTPGTTTPGTTTPGTTTPGTTTPGTTTPGTTTPGTTTPGTANPRPTTPVGTTNNGGAWGDPHFIGADGGKYDVQGKPNTYYNIISDAGFQMNAKFVGNSGTTVMGEIGAVIGGDRVKVNASGQLTLNGTVMKQDGTYPTDGGGSVTKKGGVITLKDEEYTVTITSKGGHLDFTAKSKDVAKDGVMPHGLWGQTADGDNKVRNGDVGVGAQGGGAIEKLDGTISKRGDKETVKLYEVGSLFDTSFANFNRFNGDAGGRPAVHSGANGGGEGATA
ncbi:hypothetical protein [Thiofilum flexile]|uniref:hypothetical protein n=1 Tax=Thiofilum flexile TaxID=125627 RepID=UPI00036A26D0|nr:hypothetical protein [Thiofilum flexile]